MGSGKHAGLWSEFRQAAGLSKDSAPSNEDGYTFVFVLLTGREARLINESGWRNLTRLRYGSVGVDVETLQLELTNTNRKARPRKNTTRRKKTAICATRRPAPLSNGSKTRTARRTASSRRRRLKSSAWISSIIWSGQARTDRDAFQRKRFLHRQSRYALRCTVGHSGD